MRDCRPVRSWAIIWARIDAESSRADQFAAEADRRGTAVTTLADDVRALRAQIRAQGNTPIAPDPGDAVEGLDDRGTVPVPFPVPGEKGDKGDKGDPGDPGKPAPTLTPAPGASGLPGQDATGAPGKDGQDGQDGRDGADGQDGEPPAGWTWNWTDQLGGTHTYSCTPAPDFDPDAPRYQCTVI
ncbi:hypothetical protein OG937_10710 [Streptomyces sp. NBC_00510]